MLCKGGKFAKNARHSWCHCLSPKWDVRSFIRKKKSEPHFGQAVTSVRQSETQNARREPYDDASPMPFQSRTVDHCIPIQARFPSKTPCIHASGFRSSSVVLKAATSCRMHLGGQRLNATSLWDYNLDLSTLHVCSCGNKRANTYPQQLF